MADDVVDSVEKAAYPGHPATPVVDATIWYKYQRAEKNGWQNGVSAAPILHTTKQGISEKNHQLSISLDEIATEWIVFNLRTNSSPPNVPNMATNWIDLPDITKPLFHSVSRPDSLIQEPAKTYSSNLGFVHQGPPGQNHAHEPHSIHKQTAHNIKLQKHRHTPATIL